MQKTEPDVTQHKLFVGHIKLRNSDNSAPTIQRTPLNAN